MKVRFYGDKRYNGQMINIIMSISHDYKKSMRSTGISVERKYWDFKKNWLKNDTCKQVITARNKMYEIKDFIETLGVGTAKEASICFDKEFKNVKVLQHKKINGIYEYIHEYIQLISNRYSMHTIRKYKKTAENIKLFCCKHNLHDDLTKMTTDDQKIFFSKFCDFLCYEEIKNNNGGIVKHKYQNETMRGAITCVKSVCNHFESIGITVKLSKISNTKLFKSPGQKKAFCTPEEIIKIYNARCSSISEEEARDCCVFQAFTGLRHNELYNVTSNNISSMMVGQEVVKVLSHVQNKSKKRNNIPLNNICTEIIQKYKSKKFDAPKKYDRKNKKWIIFSECLLPVRSNQKTNSHLHNICKNVNINSTFSEIKYSGTDKIEKTRPKHEAITTHSMRHSFAFYMKEKGMPDGLVADLMGIDESTYRNNYRHTFGSKSIIEAYKLLNTNQVATKCYSVTS